MSKTDQTIESIEKILGLASTGLDVASKGSDVLGKGIETHKSSLKWLFITLAILCGISCCVVVVVSIIAGILLAVMGGKGNDNDKKNN